MNSCFGADGTFARTAIFIDPGFQASVQFRRQNLLEEITTFGRILKYAEGQSEAVKVCSVYNWTETQVKVSKSFTGHFESVHGTEYLLLDTQREIELRIGVKRSPPCAYIFYSKAEREAFLTAPYLLELTTEELLGIRAFRSTYPTDDQKMHEYFIAEKIDPSSGQNTTQTITRFRAIELLQTNLECRTAMRENNTTREALISRVTDCINMVGRFLEQEFGQRIPVFTVRAEVARDGILELHGKLEHELPNGWFERNSDRFEQFQQTWFGLEDADPSELPWSCSITDRLKTGGHRLSLATTF